MNGPVRSGIVSGLGVIFSYLCAASLFGFDLAWFPVAVWHFADQATLLADPVTTLACLHTQPPMLNALLWVVLKAEVSLNVPVGLTAFAILMAAGWLGLWSLHRSMSIIGSSRVADVLTLMVALTPCFMRHGHQFFYTFLLFALVAFVHLQIVQYIRGPSPHRFVGLVFSLLLLVLSRSLFPFPWAVLCLFLVIGLGWWATRRLPFSNVPMTFGVCILSTVVLALLPSKNLILHGAFTSSSWQGLNLTRAVPNDRSGELMASLVSANDLSQLPQNACRDWPMATASERTLFGTTTPNMHDDRHLLAMEPLSEVGVSWRLEHPGEYLDNVLGFYARATGPSFSRQFGGTRPEDPWFTTYSEAVFALPFASVPIGDGRSISVFGLVILPLFFLVSILGAARCRATEEWRAGVILVGALWVAWTVVLPVLTDGMESPRMRFGSFAPMVVTLVALAYALGRRRVGDRTVRL